MSEIRLRMRCPGCGALNRMRLPTGKRLRVRCGSCGQALPVSRGRLLRAWAGQQVQSFFTRGLPLALLALVERLVKALGLLLFPLAFGWRKLSPEARGRVLWTLIGGLALAYLYFEGSEKLGNLLNLGMLLAGVSLAVLLFVRGPRALLDRLRSLAGGIFRRCGACGHSYFGWLKRCPKCGRGR